MDNGPAARDLRFGALPSLTRVPLQLLRADGIGWHPIEAIWRPCFGTISDHVAVTIIALGVCQRHDRLGRGWE
jgi:hypothetical protein